jgi:aryl-alcohol dehydrogenase-like predicted oxidoreductase
MEEICAALDRAVRDGKVIYLGASSMHAWEFMKLISLQRQAGLAPFVSMQNHYNLLYREEEREMIPLCLSEGIGLIPWSPLARGLLTRPATHQTTARSTSDQYSPKLYGAPHEKEVLTALQTAANQMDASMAQVALAWLLAKPGVIAPIIGATRIGQLEEALKAVDLGLDPAIIQSLEAPYRPRSIAGID